MTAPPPDPQPQLRDVLEGRVAAALPLGAGILAALFTVYAAAHLRLLEPSVSRVMAPLAAASAITYLAIFLWLRRRPVPPGRAHALAGLMALPPLGNSLTHLYLTGEPLETTNLLLLLVAVGCIFLSLRWFVFVVGLALVGWAAIVNLHLPASPELAAGPRVGASEWLHYGFALLGGVVLASLVLAARLRSHVSLQALRQQDADRRQELKEALAAAAAELAERKQAERGLRLSQFSLQNAGDGVLWVSPEGRIRLANATACDTLGYTAEELHDRPIADLHPSYAMGDWPGFWTRLRQEGRIRFDSHQRTRDGREFPVEVNVSFLTHEGEEHAFAWVRDISERIRAEQAMRRGERQFRASFHQTALGMAIIGRDGGYREVNRAFCDMLGYEPEELTQMRVMDLTPPDERASFRERATAMLGEAGLEPHVVEKRYKRKDGTELWARTTRTGVSEEGTTPSWFLSVIEDVTERRNADLALREAKEAAEVAVRSKAEFLATMSHELRTPMNAVIGLTDLLLDTELTREQRDHLETVRNSGDALLAVINDILDFSKMEAGSLSLEILDFDLRQVVEEVVDLFAESAQRKGLELASLVYRDVPAGLAGDPGRLRQILMNLIGNAVKFTANGEVIVRTRKVGEQGGRARIRFEVSDTGIGVPEDRRDQLFEPFTQADASTTRRFGGSGLGLAICAKIARQMGGAVGLESRVGEGSTFWVEVELGAEVGTRRDLPVALDGLRVIVVDDNATNRGILLQQLSSWGAEASAAASGREGLALLRGSVQGGRSFDCAILDMQMPEMDGLELAEAIRAEPSLAGIRILLLTSLTGPGAETAERAGIDLCLTKPARATQLREILARMRSAPSPREAATDDAHRVAPISPGTNAPRVLVAEDNAVNQKVAARMLSRLGYRSHVVSTGKEAVEACARVPYAAVLMDCRMPEMDGFEATARIREQEAGSGRHIRIIAMTASAMAGDRERCLEAGMDGYLSKPVRLRSLALALSDDRRTATSEATQPDAAPITEIDRDGLLERADHDLDLVGRLVAIFQEQAPHQLDELQKARSAGDASGVARAAHTLCGSAANLGAVAAAETARRIEAIAEGTLVGDLDDECRQLDVRIRRALPLLRELALSGERIARS